MQEALLLLFLVILVVVIFIAVSYEIKENFTDNEELHSDFISRQLRQWGDVGISLITAKKEGTLGDSADKMLQTVGVKSSYPLNSGKNGLWEIIDKCEAIKTMDCNAFDNASFAKDCGICLDIGENSDKVKATGGLVLLSDDKQTAKQGAHSNFLPNYKPTIGFCPAGKMVSTKEECLKLQRQLLCNKNSSYDQPDCSQCFSDTTYSIVDPKTSPGVISDSGSISVIGVGKLKIEEQGYSAKTGIILSTTKSYDYTVRGKEGSRIKFVLEEPPNSDEDNPIVPYISGVLTGETGTGTFSQDLRRIVLVDEVTGRKPRSKGKATLNGTPVSTMSPGYGQNTATIIVIVPFSFTDTTTEESTLCKDAPFVTTQAAAEFLGSDPCYKKGSGPGKFSLECLQGIWEDNSCTGGGSGYPKDASSAATLMTGSDGSFLSLNDIADFIYNKALITSTGIDEDGKKKSMKDWSDASVFCTGQEITSPCDTQNKNSGPLSPECIIHLWNNQSSKKTWQGKDDPIGSTYYTSNAVSLFSEGPVLRSCQATGTLSPIDPQGNKKKDIIKYWQKQGGVNNVKRVMADLHKAANAQAVADDQLSPYFKQCYGDIQMAPRPATKFSIQNNKLPETYTISRNNVLVSSLKMTQDYKLQFVITPRQIYKGNESGGWTNIIHFTALDKDCCEPGTRSPAIWFWPGELRLLVTIGASGDGGWGINIPGCELNKESSFSLECRGTSVKITLDGKVFSATHPNWRYSGNVKVYGSDNWYPSAIADIKDVGLQLFGNSTSTEDRIINKIDIRNADTQSFNINTSIPLQNGQRIDTNFPNMPNFDACISAAMAKYPGQNIGVTYLDGNSWINRNPGSCWAVPMEPFSAGSNPWAWGWKSAFVTSGKIPSISGVTRVRIAGGIQHLQLSQVVVYDEDAKNISIGRSTDASAIYDTPTIPSKAVDGYHGSRNWPEMYCSASNTSSDTHWDVILDKPSNVSAVIVYNRYDCCQERLDNYNLLLFNSANELIYWKPKIGITQREYGNKVNIIRTNSSTNQVSQTPPQKIVVANNGSVNCQQYCLGPRFIWPSMAPGPWNGELPVNWNGAKCVASSNPDVGCLTTPGVRNGFTCTCEKTGTGW
jgi:hypothetical protein